MNRQPLHPNESWENDAVWKLLDQAPSASAGPRFVDDTVRAARLTIQAQPWWLRLMAPAPLAGLAAATAALVFAVVMLLDSAPQPAMTNTMFDAKQAAAIQDIADSETLIAAVDHLDEFSDTELVSLIGF
jgi:hypothetical protein